MIVSRQPDTSRRTPPSEPCCALRFRLTASETGCLDTNPAPRRRFLAQEDRPDRTAVRSPHRPARGRARSAPQDLVALRVRLWRIVSYVGTASSRGSGHIVRVPESGAAGSARSPDHRAASPKAGRGRLPNLCWRDSRAWDDEVPAVHGSRRAECAASARASQGPGVPSLRGMLLLLRREASAFPVHRSHQRAGAGRPAWTRRLPPDHPGRLPRRHAAALHELQLGASVHHRQDLSSRGRADGRVVAATAGSGRQVALCAWASIRRREHGPQDEWRAVLPYVQERLVSGVPGEAEAVLTGVRTICVSPP
jgi:hypothetical protein